MAPLMIAAMSLMGVLLVLFTVLGILHEVWEHKVARRIGYGLVWLILAFAIIVLGFSLYKFNINEGIIRDCVGFIQNLKGGGG